MILLHGEGVSPGRVRGRLQFFQRLRPAKGAPVSAAPKEEARRFQEARQSAVNELGSLYRDTRVELGEGAAVLFQTHQMLLEDPDFQEAVTALLYSGRVSAENAVQRTSEQFSRAFGAMEDEYMRARGADLQDVSHRVCRILAGRGEETPLPRDGAVLAAFDLLPSETVRMGKAGFAAFLTVRGSGSSHAAMFARTLGIPAVVHLGPALQSLPGGTELLVDGGAGTVADGPD